MRTTFLYITVRMLRSLRWVLLLCAGMGWAVRSTEDTTHELCELPRGQMHYIVYAQTLPFRSCNVVVSSLHRTQNTLQSPQPQKPRPPGKSCQCLTHFHNPSPGSTPGDFTVWGPGAKCHRPNASDTLPATPNLALFRFVCVLRVFGSCEGSKSSKALGCSGSQGVWEEGEWTGRWERRGGEGGATRRLGEEGERTREREGGGRGKREGERCSGGSGMFLFLVSFTFSSCSLFYGCFVFVAVSCSVLDIGVLGKVLGQQNTEQILLGHVQLFGFLGRTCIVESCSTKTSPSSSWCTAPSSVDARDGPTERARQL